MLQNEQIKKYIESGDISISPFKEENLGSVSYDLTVGTIVRSKHIVKDYDNFEYDLSKEDHRKIEITDRVRQMETVLFCTKEVVSVSRNITAIACGRSTLFKIPAFVNFSSLVDPGFSGVLTGNLTNRSNIIIKIPKDFRICQIMFYLTENAADYSKLARSKNNNLSPLDFFKLKIDKEYRR